MNRRPRTDRPRLSLDRTTVKHLTSAELAEVVGGRVRLSNLCPTTVGTVASVREAC